MRCGRRSGCYVAALAVAMWSGTSHAATGADGAQPSDSSARVADGTPAAPVLRVFATPQAALREVLRRKPLVLAVGESHQRRDGPQVRSSIYHFTRELLPAMQRRVSDLLIETWITEGECGETQRQVARDVEQTTERPQQTEDEIVTLVKRARRYRIRPHVLHMQCSDYRRLWNGSRVDYERLLTLTATQLRHSALALLETRTDPVKRAVDETTFAMQQGRSRRGARDMIVVYGGALHNDLSPEPDQAAYSYAVVVAAAAKGRLIELDLYVPEYIAAKDALVRREPWYPAFAARTARRGTLLIQRGPSSYVLILPRTRR